MYCFVSVLAHDINASHHHDPLCISLQFADCKSWLHTNSICMLLYHTYAVQCISKLTPFCHAEIYRLLYVFCVSCWQQNRQSLAVDISDRGRRNRTKFCRQLARGEGLVSGSVISNIDIDIIHDTFDVSISILTILSQKSIDCGIDDTLLAFLYRHYIDTSQLTWKMMHITF